MSTTTTVDVGVVVVTYNSSRHVPRLVDSLDRGMAGLRWELLVVDNHSDDDTVAALRARDLPVRVLDSNTGYAAAVNVGIEHFSEARSVLVLNPDIELSEGHVSTLLETFDDPTIGIAVPQVRDFDGELTASLRRSPTLTRAVGVALLGGRGVRHVPGLAEFVTETHHYVRSHDVAWAMGAVMLVSRACLDEVGFWDPTFFLYSEETDYCDRARAAGFRIHYVSNCVVLHVGGGGALQPRLRSMMTVNRVRHYARHHGTLRSYLYMLAVLVNDGSRAVRGDPAFRAATMALLIPRRRPPELDCSSSWLPC